METNAIDLTYTVKCRRCGKITEMYFGTTETISIKDFKIWVTEHSAFPIEKQCECDRGSIMLHDLVGFTIAII